MFNFITVKSPMDKNTIVDVTLAIDDISGIIAYSDEEPAVTIITLKSNESPLYSTDTREQIVTKIKQALDLACSSNLKVI